MLGIQNYYIHTRSLCIMSSHAGDENRKSKVHVDTLYLTRCYISI